MLSLTVYGICGQGYRQQSGLKVTNIPVSGPVNNRFKIHLGE